MLGLNNPYRDLEKALGYRFRRRALLETALVHRSYRFEQDGEERDNQRLEFLGDAVLGLLAAAHLFELVADGDEGDLTNLRSRIASGRALAALARRIDLGRYLKIGRGEDSSGGRERRSNLADALEAVVGAVYIDGGPRAAQRMFDRLFAPLLAELDRDAWAGNPKGQFQELSQRRWKAGPVYRLVSREGPAHCSVFTVDVVVNGEVRGTGSGSSKQEAEREAARAALAGCRG